MRVLKILGGKKFIAEFQLIVEPAWEIGFRCALETDPTWPRGLFCSVSFLWLFCELNVYSPTK